MKYIFFTIDGQGLPIAHHLQNEGYDVYVGQVPSWDKTGIHCEEDAEQTKRRLSLYDGLLYKDDADSLLKKMEKVPNKKDYFVVCDFNYLHSVADKAREMGYTGLLPTHSDYELEHDRKKAKEIIQKNYPDLSVNETHEFRKVEEALSFIKESKTLYVIKGFNEDAPTVVPESDDVDFNHEEVKNRLERDRELYEKDGFIIEEKIPDLIEFTPEAVSYDGKVLGVSVNIEEKRLGAGDTGIQTGCATDLIEWIPLEDDEIYRRFLKPLEPLMLREGEMTLWDASVLYSPSRDKYYFGEFCPNRFGYNCIFSELSTLPSVSEYFERIVAKEPLFGYKVKKFGSSVRVFNLIKDPKRKELFISDALLFSDLSDKNIWVWDVKKKNDFLFTAGYDKNLSVVTGSGDTIEESSHNAYLSLENFHFTEKYYRPLSDYLSTEYPTSIMGRLSFLHSLKQEKVEVPDDEVRKLKELHEREANKMKNKIGELEENALRGLKNMRSIVEKGSETHRVTLEPSLIQRELSSIENSVGILGNSISDLTSSVKSVNLKGVEDTLLSLKGMLIKLLSSKNVSEEDVSLIVKNYIGEDFSSLKSSVESLKKRGGGSMYLNNALTSEVPSGAVNGSNTVFTTTQPFLFLVLNNTMPLLNTDYTLSSNGKIITYTTAPAPGSTHFVIRQ